MQRHRGDRLRILEPLKYFWLFVTLFLVSCGGNVAQYNQQPPPPPTTTVSDSQHYAAANGATSGDGSIGNPWDLATALAGPAAVHPGDTIWLRGGLYGGAEGTVGT